MCSNTVSTNATTSWGDAAAAAATDDDDDDDVDDDHGPGMMEKRGLRFAHDEKPLAHSLLLLTHYYLISLHSVAALVCCLFCACCSLSLQPPLLLPRICFVYPFPEGGGPQAGNDDSDIGTRVCVVCAYMLTTCKWYRQKQ